MKNLLILLIILFSGILFQSCATLFGGRHNHLVFKEESSPPAKVFIDGRYVGNAPGKIKLRKEVIQHGSMLEIRAEGYETQKYRILRKQHALYTIVDILTAGTGLAIDYATGNIYRPVPRSFVYNLEKAE
jgi:hypothetical protein